MSRIIEGAINEKNQLIVEILIFQEPFCENDISDERYREKHIFHGLIDTGASNSTISSRVVRQLRLTSSGKSKLTSATETTIANYYNVHIVVPKSQIEDIAVDAENNSVSVQKNFEGRGFNVVACELPNHDNDFDALIGMDVLRGCLFIIDRERFILSF